MGPLLRWQHFAADEARSTDLQFEIAASQRHTGRQPCWLAALGLAANLDNHAFTLVEPSAAWENFARGQKGCPVAPDVYEYRAQRRHKPSHPPKMYAARLAAIAAFDIELDRNAVLEQCRAPIARSGGDQQVAGQWTR